MRRTRAVAGLAVAFCLIWAGTAQAASIFTVNTRGDNNDADTADGICDTSAALAGKQCSMRAAIQQANVASDSDFIMFDIPGTGVQRIQPHFQLPTISQPVTINGYSQPGASANTATDGTTNAVIRIDLDGSLISGDAVGLGIGGGNTTVRGLAINNFPSSVSGGFGIELFNLAANTNNVIRGNFIGTNPAGTASERNGSTGIVTFGASTGNSIGGTTAAAPNLVSGNGSHGINVSSASNTVTGNLVGTDKTGTADIGNHGSGIFANASGNTLVQNTVAFNFENGVTVNGGTGNEIGANSIFNNDGLGIDLGRNGPTPNDGGAANDADTGANNLQNFPTFNSAQTNGAGATTVGVTLDSAPNQDYTIRFFRNPVGTVQGKTFVESTTVHTDANGFVFSVVSLTHTVPAGETLTATATDPANNTSEFSPGKLVRAVP
jgi:trimeric autotransporter adhesin